MKSNKMQTVLDYFGLSPVQMGKVPKSYKDAVHEIRINSDLACGIEVEVENHHMNRQPNDHVWLVKGDGSLRNNGMEWITLPIEARYTPIALQELLGEGLAKECCFSPRTSIHVHLDMQKHTTTQVVDVVMLYTLMEDLLYRYTGRGRAKNIYCVPIVDTSMLHALSQRTLKQVLQNWAKYSGLNLLPLNTYGTIEFRHMHGTFDVTKVARWIRMLVSMVEYCLTQGTENIRKLALSDQRTFDMGKLLTEVFGEDASFLKYRSSADYIRGLDGVKTTFMSVNGWKDLTNSISSQSPYLSFKGK